MKRFFIISALFWIVSIQLAAACSPAFKPWWQNQPVRHQADCSFTGGGRHDFTTGGPAIDIGNNRVYQIIDYDGPFAIVADCGQVSAIMIFGVPVGPETSCGQITDINSALPPKGHLDLSIGERLVDLVVHSNQLGLGVGLSATNFTNSKLKSDKPDVFCGCKKYYPQFDYEER